MPDLSKPVSVNLDQVWYARTQNVGRFAAIWQKLLAEKGGSELLALDSIRTSLRAQQDKFRKPYMARVAKSPVGAEPLSPVRKRTKLEQEADGSLEDRPKAYAASFLIPNERDVIRRLFYKRGQKPPISVAQVKEARATNAQGFARVFADLLARKGGPGNERKVMDAIRGTCKSAFEQNL